MRQFKDKRTRAVYETQFATGIPKHVSVAAHEAMRVLVASRSLQDVGTRGAIIRWLNAPDLFGTYIYGKWYVTYAWSEDFGAAEICLEKR